METLTKILFVAMIYLVQCNGHLLPGRPSYEEQISEKTIQLQADLDQQFDVDQLTAILASVNNLQRTKLVQQFADNETSSDNVVVIDGNILSNVFENVFNVNVECGSGNATIAETVPLMLNRGGLSEHAGEENGSDVGADNVLIIKNNNLTNVFRNVINIQIG